MSNAPKERTRVEQSKKRCDHHSTHGCPELIDANQTLCTNCAAGNCQV